MSDKKTVNPKAKRTYKKPKLKTHGTLKDLTKAKGGRKADGAGKPASRLSGPSA
jgi:hypothetical protein